MFILQYQMKPNRFEDLDHNFRLHYMCHHTIVLSEQQDLITGCYTLYFKQYVLKIWCNQHPNVIRKHLLKKIKVALILTTFSNEFIILVLKWFNKYYKIIPICYTLEKNFTELFLFSYLENPGNIFVFYSVCQQRRKN